MTDNKMAADPLTEAAKELLASGLLGPRERKIVASYADPCQRRDAQPVECVICDWRGRRKNARSAPCPSCGSKVNYR